MISVSTLGFPAALFAQTGGIIEPATSSTPETAQAVPVETAARPAEAPVTEPAAYVPEPALAQAAAPTPRTDAAQPAPAQPLADAPIVEAATSTPAPEPVLLEDIQEAVEAIAEEAPSVLRPWLYALAGALGAIIAVLGIQAWLKKARQKGTKKCERCGGTGHEHASETCVGCEGKGKIEEEYEATVECPHCGGEGEEPCEPCEGEGEYDGKPCATCAGAGVKKDEESEPIECGTCLGEGEASVTLKRDVACPDCKR